MEEMTLTDAVATRLIANTTPALLAWFTALHLCRYAVEGDEEHLVELVAPPVLLLGPDDSEVYACPDPDLLGYPEKTLAAMSLDDYHIFLWRWFSHAVAAGACRCCVCKQPMTADPGAPWDGIFIDKELVGWLIIHFDCKRGLAREVKGRHPFDLTPQAPTHYDVARD